MAALACPPPAFIGKPLNVQIATTGYHDSARKRDIPVTIFYPLETGAAPVILFSPGAGAELP